MTMRDELVLRDNPPDKFDGVLLTNDFGNDLAAINKLADQGFTQFVAEIHGTGYTAVLMGGYKP